jgi:hypothetical protein
MNFASIDDYLTFLDTNCQPVKAAGIVPGEMYAFFYQWAVDEYPAGMDFDEWDQFPLAIASDSYTAENGSRGFLAINTHHLPVIIRIALVGGKSLSDKLVKDAIRRYRYSGLVAKLWWVPDSVRAVAVLFHPNTYERSSYNKRFGKPPTVKQIAKKFPAHYWDLENSAAQF